MEPAGDRDTRLLLQRRYRSVGCYYCKSDAHSYESCPKKPCFLCKQLGHSVAFCPYKTNAPLNAQQQHHQQQNTVLSPRLHYLRCREVGSSSAAQVPFIPAHNSFRSARIVLSAVKEHSNRVTCAEWSPDGSLIMSGDKSGVLRAQAIAPQFYCNDGGIDVNALDGRTETGKPLCRVTSMQVHRCNINALVVDPRRLGIVYSTSGDGAVCESRVDANNGTRREDEGAAVLLNVNPEGWVSASTWRMLYGLAWDPLRSTLFVGMSDGSVARVDPREHSTVQARARFHSDKVTTIDVNVSQPNLIATASNDTTVRLWDARKFMPRQNLGSFTHGRVVCSAFFSPRTGSKLLTTSFDNRLRVWHDVHAIQGDANAYVDSQPDHTIIHSHDFHRHISPFKAAWDPNDWNEDSFLCGRFLGEAYKGMSSSNGNSSNNAPLNRTGDADGDDEAVLLRPVDIFSAKSGRVALSLVDPSLPLICTINRFCPKANAILTAASKGLYIWAPPSRPQRSARSTSPRPHDRRDDDDDSDDENGGGGPGRKKKKKRNVSVSVQTSQQQAT